MGFKKKHGIERGKDDDTTLKKKHERQWNLQALQSTLPSIQTAHMDTTKTNRRRFLTKTKEEFGIVSRNVTGQLTGLKLLTDSWNTSLYSRH